MKHVQIAADYADGVNAGRIDACLYVRQACGRFLRDLQSQNKTEWPYEFDAMEADRWCRFLEHLPHVKGKWAARRESFKLSPWQTFCTVNIFGWRRKGTEFRRFREAYIEVPRKNGKSLWAAGMGIGMLSIDHEMGAEIYCGATSEKQAWEIFRPARSICQRKETLREKYGIEVNAKTLNILSDGSRFEPLIGDPGDGASPSMAIADEFHEHKDSDQVDTMITGMGARQQPLMLYITTAGADMGGPCYAKRVDVMQILSGAVDDDSIFGIVYTLDKDDAWDTVDAQKKANPNYDVSIDSEFLAAQLRQARRSAVKQAAYKTKHLNLWVGARSPWMNMLAFQLCRKKGLSIDDYAGRRCFLGLDLASKVDLASLAVVFPPEVEGEKWAVFMRRWVPEEKVLEGEGTRYKAWHSDGWLEATEGNVIDFSSIEDALRDIGERFQVEEVPYDPFQATQFATRMTDEGFPMVQYGATVKNFSEPMKGLEALVLQRGIEFQDDPVLMWCMSNVVARKDKKDNIYPTKEIDDNKIDDVIAIIMAYARAMHSQESVYQDRGVIVL